jgi:hypothetical protein
MKLRPDPYYKYFAEYPVAPALKELAEHKNIQIWY